MSVDSDLVEVEVRCLHVPNHRMAHPHVVVGRRDQTAGPTLCVQIGVVDVPDMTQELSGADTARLRALELVGRVADVCGGRLLAGHLVAHGKGRLGTALEIETPYGTVCVPAQAGDVLSAAVRLGVPLLADRALFDDPAPEVTELAEPLRALLDGLNLEGTPQHD